MGSYSASYDHFQIGTVQVRYVLPRSHDSRVFCPNKRKVSDNYSKHGLCECVQTVCTNVYDSPANSTCVVSESDPISLFAVHLYIPTSLAPGFAMCSPPVLSHNTPEKREETPNQPQNSAQAIELQCVISTSSYPTLKD